VEKCDETAEDWHLAKVKDSNMFSILLGPDNKFIACWDAGDHLRNIYTKEPLPVRKTPFSGKNEGWECHCSKVTHLPK